MCEGILYSSELGRLRVRFWIMYGTMSLIGHKWTALLGHMVWGKLLYSDLQMGNPCAAHIRSELCMGVRHLLRNYAKAIVSSLGDSTSSIHLWLSMSLYQTLYSNPTHNWLIETTCNLCCFYDVFPQDKTNTDVFLKAVTGTYQIQRKPWLIIKRHTWSTSAYTYRS